ncbi:hypothetical protein NARC_10408 [Candidatus Nitrosocosmicus arcticus]|uniref:Uncharacterized protein n=1 Tax=Candidatus Nitrosocosmicus arcticus TaxID=2035267 RepID=A0A557SZH1_9ARCH|nr:hypothetical protein NARC_10408 [Candidatus Nitrosocosmicus arcticus]
MLSEIRLRPQNKKYFFHNLNQSSYDDYDHFEVTPFLKLSDGHLTT